MKKYIVLALIATLCLSVSCGKAQTDQEVPEAVEAEITHGLPLWGIQEFNKIYTGTDLGPSVSPNLKLTVKIRVPFIESAKGNQAWTLMNESFELQGQSWLDKSVEWLGVEGLDSQIPYTVDADFAVMRSDEQYVSIRYEYYRYLGGAYPVMSLWGSTYNAQTGDPVYLADLFSVKEDFFLPVLMDKMEELAELPVSRQDLEGYFDFNNFYLTEDSLVIYYQEEQLGPHAVGTPEFKIPFADLAPTIIF
ncbi:MAG: DUF3298 domain-containing protein [Clostridia bacterium]|nr:DUF3298 domain-containing protein [Clostridia bacterium]